VKMKFRGVSGRVLNVRTEAASRKVVSRDWKELKSEGSSPEQAGGSTVGRILDSPAPNVATQLM